MLGGLRRRLPTCPSVGGCASKAWGKISGAVSCVTEAVGTCTNAVTSAISQAPATIENYLLEHIEPHTVTASCVSCFFGSTRKILGWMKSGLRMLPIAAQPVGIWFSPWFRLYVFSAGILHSITPVPYYAIFLLLAPIATGMEITRRSGWHEGKNWVLGLTFTKHWAMYFNGIVGIISFGKPIKGLFEAHAIVSFSTIASGAFVLAGITTIFMPPDMQLARPIIEDELAKFQTARSTGKLQMVTSQFTDQTVKGWAGSFAFARGINHYFMPDGCLSGCIEELGIYRINLSLTHVVHVLKAGMWGLNVSGQMAIFQFLISNIIPSLRDETISLAFATLLGLGLGTTAGLIQEYDSERKHAKFTYRIIFIGDFVFITIFLGGVIGAISGLHRNEWLSSNDKAYEFEGYQVYSAFVLLNALVASWMRFNDNLLTEQHLSEWLRSQGKFSENPDLDGFEYHPLDDGTRPESIQLQRVGSGHESTDSGSTNSSSPDSGSPKSGKSGANLADSPERTEPNDDLAATANGASQVEVVNLQPPRAILQVMMQVPGTDGVVIERLTPDDPNAQLVLMRAQAEGLITGSSNNPQPARPPQQVSPLQRAPSRFQGTLYHGDRSRQQFQQLQLQAAALPTGHGHTSHVTFGNAPPQTD